MNQSFFFETISDKYYEVAEMKLSRVHCNDCQNDLPMLDIQYEAMRSIFTSMVNAWSITVSKTEEVIKCGFLSCHVLHILVSGMNLIICVLNVLHK